MLIFCCFSFFFPPHILSHVCDMVLVWMSQDKILFPLCGSLRHSVCEAWSQMPLPTQPAHILLLLRHGFSGCPDRPASAFQVPGHKRYILFLLLSFLHDCYQHFIVNKKERQKHGENEFNKETKPY